MRRVLRRLSDEWFNAEAGPGVGRLTYRPTGLSVLYTHGLELTDPDAVWEALCTAAYDGKQGEHEIRSSRADGVTSCSLVPVAGPSPFSDLCFGGLDGLHTVVVATSS